MTRIRSITALLATGVALASTTTAAAAIPHPSGADAIVVSIEHERNGWGFEYHDGVDVRVYGDGRVVISPPATDGRPRPRSRELHVGDRAVQRLLRAARRAGLLTGTDFGDAGVTDQGTSVIRVAAAGGVRTFAVYALLLEEGDTGLAREQRAAREALRRFVHVAARASWYR